MEQNQNSWKSIIKQVFTDLRWKMQEKAINTLGKNYHCLLGLYKTTLTCIQTISFILKEYLNWQKQELKNFVFIFRPFFSNICIISLHWQQNKRSNVYEIYKSVSHQVIEESLINLLHIFNSYDRQYMSVQMMVGCFVLLKFHCVIMILCFCSEIPLEAIWRKAFVPLHLNYIDPAGFPIVISQNHS